MSLLIVVTLFLFSGIAGTVGEAVRREAGTLNAQGDRTPPTREQAAPFLGEWTSRMLGPSGPTDVLVEIKATGRTVLARVTSDLLGENEVQDIAMTDNGIALRFTCRMWGYVAPVVLTLVITGDQLQEDFSIMNGFFQMNGVATRRQAACSMAFDKCMSRQCLEEMLDSLKDTEETADVRCARACPAE